MAQITSGSDGGGWRQFLEGKPVHAGSILEVNINGRWHTVRYEANYHARTGFIYMPLAGDRERGLPLDNDTMDFRWISSDE